MRAHRAAPNSFRLGARRTPRGSSASPRSPRRRGASLRTQAPRPMVWRSYGTVAKYFIAVRSKYTIAPRDRFNVKLGRPALKPNLGLASFNTNKFRPLSRFSQKSERSKGSRNKRVGARHVQEGLQYRSGGRNLRSAGTVSHTYSQSYSHKIWGVQNHPDFDLKFLPQKSMRCCHCTFIPMVTCTHIRLSFVLFFFYSSWWCLNLKRNLVYY